MSPTQTREHKMFGGNLSKQSHLNMDDDEARLYVFCQKILEFDYKVYKR